MVRAPRVVTPQGETAASIAIVKGRIGAVAPIDADLPAGRRVEFDSEVVIMPGIVDTHVHVCDPGTDWEGFKTATKAAAAGGITTLVDMPIDSFPATLDVDSLDTKRQAAEGRCYVDVGFWGGAVPDNLEQMRPMRERGVLGFKCFLIDPGVTGFLPLNARQMQQALAVCRDLEVPLLVHAESGELAPGMAPLSSRLYTDYLASRPREMENRAVADVIQAAKRTGGHAHILHLSSGDAVAMIASARHDGVRVTAESCPHYLTLAAEEIPEGGTPFKCSPPIREASNRDALWQGLDQETLDMIVSDHSPSTVELKELVSGNFGAAWGGISSLQLSLPIVWTEARRRKHALTDLARWMSDQPARLAGLRRKGRIAPGFDADFCVLTPDETFVVEPRRLYHRHPVTPYAGRRLRGVVRQTWLRGEPVDFRQPRGELLFKRPIGAVPARRE